MIEYKTHFVDIPKGVTVKNKYYLLTFCKLPAYMQSITDKRENVTCQKCLNKLANIIHKK